MTIRWSRDKFRFDVGEVVRHVQYDYRAVVLSMDAGCRASDAWYRGNRTQPRRDQPWYHVLDEDGEERYVAEENLEPDASGDELDTPLVQYIFPAFVNGRYYRQSMN